MLRPAKSRPHHQSAKANGLSSNTPVPTDASARAQRPQGGNLCMVGMYRRTDRLVCVQPHQPCGCGWSVGTAFTLRLCCSSRTHFHRPSKQPSAHANASAPTVRTVLSHAPCKTFAVRCSMRPRHVGPTALRG